MLERTGYRYLIFSLLLLLAGIVFGITGAVQYVYPDFLSGVLPFNKIRPLHVSAVVGFIFVAAIGGMYLYLPRMLNEGLRITAARFQFGLLILICCFVFVSYVYGYFEGREYLEYPVWIGALIILFWLILAFHFFRHVSGKLLHGPVYLWMWGTGIVFFLITYFESYLWLIPYFRDNLIRDVTVQWKAMGAFVGSWNMLIYGTSFYLMEKIGGDSKQARSNISFFFYFLGLTNLMFNWGHHSYIVPAKAWIGQVAFIISMTELLILGNIIWHWRKSLSNIQKHFYITSYRFLAAADVWIFINLVIAISISIPAINYYTHGTHITVSHAMGATIGINMMILFASVFYAFKGKLKRFTKLIRPGFWFVNLGLFFFLVCLISLGVQNILKTTEHSIGQVGLYRMGALSWRWGLFLSSVLIVIGICMIIIPVLYAYFVPKPVRKK